MTLYRVYYTDSYHDQKTMLVEADTYGEVILLLKTLGRIEKVMELDKNKNEFEPFNVLFDDEA